MAWIVLEDMRFRAPVGVYEEEKINLNDISIDLSVKVDGKQAAEEDSLDLTVDYSELFRLVEGIVMEGANLLENIAGQIGKSVLDKYPGIERVKVSVHKNSPPIGGDCLRTTVKMKFSRS